MPYENLPGEIPQAVIDSVTLKMNEIAMELSPYVVNLSMEERSTKYKMGPDRLSLAQNAINVCDTLPVVVPQYVVVQDLKDDVKVAVDLNTLHLHASLIAESLSDTKMARGSEALTQAVMPLYAALKTAKDKNVPGADAAYELLNQYYDLPDQPDGGNP